MYTVCSPIFDTGGRRARRGARSAARASTAARPELPQRVLWPSEPAVATQLPRCGHSVTAHVATRNGCCRFRIQFCPTWALDWLRRCRQPSSLAHPHRLDALLSQRSSAHCSSPRSTATSGASLVIRGMLAGLEMAAQACLCGAAWAAGRTLHHHSPSVCPAALCLSLSARMLPQALHCEVLENCQELLCP